MASRKLNVFPEPIISVLMVPDSGVYTVAHEYMMPKVLKRVCIKAPEAKNRHSGFTSAFSSSRRLKDKESLKFYTGCDKNFRCDRSGQSDWHMSNCS